MHKINNPVFLLLFFTVANLAACVTRKYEAPSLDVPTAFRSSADSSSSDRSSADRSSANRSSVDSNIAANISDSGIASIPYHTFFTDPVLLKLIDSGIKRNYDLQIAIRQIDIARQTFQQAQWGNIPTVSLTAGQASITRSSDNSLNGLLAQQFTGKSYLMDYSSNVGISWEADIWGKIKSRKDAALASYLGSREAARAVQTKLVSDIAQGYYNLLMLDAQENITIRSIALYDSSISMSTLLRNAGDVTSLAVEQEEAAREAAAALLPQLHLQITIQENALSELTGRNAGKIERSASLTSMQLHESLPTGIPVNMISKRPDIRQAEQALLQAHALMNVSRASLYPNLSISAQGGLNSYQFSNWFTIPGSLFGLASGSLIQPILQGRQLKTKYEQSKTAREQAELQFKQTILSALEEVSNALVTIDELHKQEDHTARQTIILAQAVANARLLFQSGQAGYLDVLTAQNSRLQADLSLAALQRQRLSSEVLLYQALGGGWQ